MSASFGMAKEALQVGRQAEEREQLDGVPGHVHLPSWKVVLHGKLKKVGLTAEQCQERCGTGAPSGSVPMDLTNCIAVPHSRTSAKTKERASELWVVVGSRCHSGL